MIRTRGKTFVGCEIDLATDEALNREAQHHNEKKAQALRRILTTYLAFSPYSRQNIEHIDTTESKQKEVDR